MRSKRSPLVSTSLRELAYPADSAELFEPLANRAWSMFLDSGDVGGQAGRYDIMVADPVATLVTHGAVTEVSVGDMTRTSVEDPLELLRRELERHTLPRPIDPTLPFAGGAVGYFSYDLGRRFESLPAVTVDVAQLPEMAVGIYDGAVIVDHVLQRAIAVGSAADSMPALMRTSVQRWPFVPPAEAAIESSLDRDAYGAAFRRVLEYIRAGDCYQVNLARRFSAPVQGDAWAGYRKLRKLSPVPHGAYLNTPSALVLSASPERFLRVRDDLVETRPIKGTRPRHTDTDADRHMAQELLVSAKDRAENVMIVDLLRNDLGKVCAAGSVCVEALCALESFANVHHLVSTVTGRLVPGVHALDVLRASFPGGSITGAPKIRAMQIIEELECERRSVYCGAIGYVGFDGAMDLNVAIRTLTYSAGEVRFWAGGGIVADSNEEAEFQETLAKAAAMFALLGR